VLSTGLSSIITLLLAIRKIRSDFDERLRDSRHPLEESIVNQDPQIIAPAVPFDIAQLYSQISQYVDQDGYLRYPTVSNVKEEERTAQCIQEAALALCIRRDFLREIRGSVIQYRDVVTPAVRSWIQAAALCACSVHTRYKQAKGTHSRHHNGKGKAAGFHGSSRGRGKSGYGSGGGKAGGRPV
jgi:hypothetical protein